MRSLKTLLAFGALGGAYLALDAATRPDDRATAGPATATGLGLAEILAVRTGLAVTDVVAAPLSDGERDFRALLNEDGRLRPVYGRVRTSCEGGTGTPDCWEIAYLEVDGRAAADRIAVASTKVAPGAEIETADAVEVPRKDTGGDVAASMAVTSTPAPATPDESPDLAGEGAAPAAGSGVHPVPSPRPEIVMMDTKAPEPAPTDGGGNPVRPPTHAVDRPIINARSGPGTGSDVVARLPAGLKLALVGESEGWGRFIVLDGDASGREVWAALAIVKPLD